MKLKVLFAATAPMLAMIAGGAQAQNIQVQVNGSPVSFDGPGPIERNDSVLVPLRGVFEAMGATVDYNSNDHTVHAYRGGQEVRLAIGATQATVGGQTVDLSQPASIVGGATMVPLRFVAESLGARVDWQSADNTVAIHTGDRDAQQPTDTGTPSFTMVKGHVASVSRMDDGSQVIKLDDGQKFTLAHDARITMNGNSIGVDEIQPYERVSLRVNSDDGRAVRVMVNPGNGPGMHPAPEVALAHAPHIMTPADGATVGQHVDIAGKSAPGATVRLTVTFAGKSNGGGYAIHGTQMSRDVVADDAGNWATTIRLNADANNLDDDTVHYTISAQNVGGNGDLSPTESISVGGGRVYAHRRGLDTP